MALLISSALASDEGGESAGCLSECNALSCWWMAIESSLRTEVATLAR